MIRFLIEKEFKLLIRNPFIPRIILFFPIMVMLILPFAANMEVKHINLSVVDNDHSSYSQRLVQKISGSIYFTIVDNSPSYDIAMERVEDGSVDMVLQIPLDFEHDLRTGVTPHLLIAANAVNGTKGGLGSSYLSSIVADWSQDIIKERGRQAMMLPPIEVVPQFRFNPTMNYRIFMVPALMVMLLTLVCGFLPTFNIVGEKESGTIEQMNVSPISKFSFILAKLVPYWIIGFIVISLCFLLAWGIHDLLPRGSLLVIYLAVGVFILAVSGVGLIISNYSQTMQQAMFVMFFFMLIFILLSGLFTPISSMPHWAQVVTRFNPLRYFIEIMRGVYLKGNTFISILPQLLHLAGFALLFNVWAMISYRKSM